MKPITVIVIADLHANSTVGLCPPTVTLDDGGSYTPSTGQRWLWRRWQDFIAQAKTATIKRRVYLITDGDLVDKDAQQRSFQMITRNPTTAKRIAVDCLHPLVALADRLFVVRGTEAHAGRSASLEEQLAEDLGAERDPERGTHSWWHLLADLGGVRFDVTHHTTIERQPWMANASMVRLAKATVLQCAERGEPTPDLVLRAHMHQYRDSHDASPLCRAITLPAWTLATAHVHRMAPGAMADVGGLIVSVDAGRPEVYVHRYPAGRRHVWVERR